MMSNEQHYRMPFVAALISFFQVLKTMLVPMLFLFVMNFKELTLDIHSKDFFQTMFMFGMWGIFITISLVSGIVHWLTFHYWFEDDELRVRSGVFVKKKRYIPFERIQTLNYKEGVFHRLFGFVKVEVETAGNSGEPEVSFTALTKASAEQIEKEMKLAKHRATQSDNVEDEYITPDEVVIKPQAMYKMAIPDLLVLASTSGGVGVVIAGVLTAMSQMTDIIPYKKIWGELAELAKYGVLIIALMVVAALIVVWVISVLLALINYYNFTVQVKDDDLIITRGLIEKKRITIPLKRVQAIKIVENPLRQLMGYATVTLECAGGEGNGNDKKMVLFPLIKAKELANPLHELFPHYQWQNDFIASPKRALPFFYRVDYFWIIPGIVACNYYFYPWGLLSFLFIPLNILFAMWQQRTAAFALNNKQLVLRYRGVSRVTFYVHKHRIQSLSTRQSYFQKRKQIMALNVHVMSGLGGTAAETKGLEQSDVEHIMTWYEHKQEV